MKQIENVRITVSIKVEKISCYETKAVSNIERIVAGSKDLKTVLQDVKSMVTETRAQAVDSLTDLIAKEEAEEEKQEEKK
jgi:hypothetical protein